MTDDERERFLSLIEAIDLAVSERPDLLSNPVGFFVSALVTAGRAEPDDAWRQLAGIGDVLAYAASYVRGEPGYEQATIVEAIAPRQPAPIAAGG